MFVIFQQQFNMFVLCMRQDYIDKRKAFRQIIDVHKTELDEKERYWNEMLTVNTTNTNTKFYWQLNILTCLWPSKLTSAGL